MSLTRTIALDWLRTFKPQPILASRREKILGCLGALLGLFVTERLSSWLLGSANPWFIAPMGASAVLLFAVPASPLAQPWSILGGNLVSAIIGVTCALFIPDRGIAAGVSAGLAIACMFSLRCLHPPSGAIALTAVLGGPAIAALGYSFVLYPVLLNSLLLTALAILINVAARRKYPHRTFPHVSPVLTKDIVPSERLGFTVSDLESAINAHGELLDVTAEDLADILSQAEILAHRRRFGDVRCVDIMSKDLIVVKADTSLSEAKTLIMKHGVTALPVVNDFDELEGLISLYDFLSPEREGIDDFPFLLRSPETKVGEIMTKKVLLARSDQPIAELVALFTDGGWHRLPVVDAMNHLIGIVSQTDLIAGLYQAQIHTSRTKS